MTKDKFISLKRKLQERVKRSKEPFKGTLASVSATFAETDNNQNSDQEQEREQEQQPTPFEKKLRERIAGSTAPFWGTLSRTI